ncbi:MULTISPECIES: Rap family tetratricopeptide repeat protein [Bacillus]|uniref:Tetratricopeptide repeat protein n=1 Tax=Bacillus glycinifermentans TaxID=1664069 RepID=A0AAJ3YWF6_9BACI|nr:MULTISPECIES: Rap family tetratricopeptide repeat protein [Bacillus]KKB75066.1 aspartate phosphatase [Bacillus sp. TH008]MBU8787854.1 tetratricopeptide repeat protein [Bacillus glycinifermentans]MDU0071563.1 Rap family tetratricopeptide repeat protein [Bacillus sp. IG6]MED8019344.1 tetratricopeptide repeat protein [Bacillus glycinifermentans]NUJ18845.1 tetratricopeptide repeat protein [Bacillus glycinifermentans]
MKQKIPSEYVAAKLNDWYSAIRKNQVAASELLKAEILRDFEDMEENQDVLLYYSLLEFRHKLMLSYLKPKKSENIEKNLRDLEEKEDQMTGLLNYYFWFFKGMYEFKKREFVKAISCYKMAEQKVNALEDKVEKAEFYYKLAEIYYYINQRYLSINYATMASDIFQSYETLKEKKIYCDFIIAGNLVESMKYNDALTNLKHALEDAETIGNSHLTASAHFNLGNCYFYLKAYQQASEHMENALSIFEKETSSYVPKVLYNLMYVRLKQSRHAEAAECYEKGIKSAASLHDEEHEAKLNILRGLYLDGGDRGAVQKGFDYLESKRLYAAVEELALDAAQYYNQIERLKDSIFYYEKSAQARRKIQRGDALYES